MSRAEENNDDGVERASESSSTGAVEELPDGSVVIPVLEEELVVTTRAVVRERVIVRKRLETVQERVEEELASERVEIEADDDVELEGDVARTLPNELERPGATVVQALLTVDDIPTLRNIPVIAFDGEELGHVGDVFYDERTRLIWSVGVARDRLGLRRREVPIEGAVLRDGALHLPRTSAELEHAAVPDSAERAGPGTPTPDTAASASEGELVRHEEELRVGTRVRQVGTLRARKHVDRRRDTQIVPRTVEHFDDEVERVPPAADDSGELEVLEDGSISIPVVEQKLVVTKRTVIRERVVIRKGTEADRYRIVARLRRERVEAEPDSNDRQADRTDSTRP